tara:strand:+ start:1787 stop:3766 length:1980 start_codon:yes stop_codon:yes gene_type:complete
MSDSVTKQLVAGERKPEQTTEDAPGALTWTDRARLASQGATYNFSDELIGTIRGLVSGDLTVGQAIDLEREQLAKSRKKPGALATEIGGAVLPGLLLAPFSGGASAAVSLANLAKIGAGQGALATVGAAEGDPIERVVENPLAIATGAAIGGVGGPAITKTVQGMGALTIPLQRITDWTMRKLGGRLPRAAEQELLTVLEQNKLPIEEVIDRVGQGEIIPDMSEELAKYVRALYAKSGRGAEIIASNVTRRSTEKASGVLKQMKQDLAPGAETPNVTRAVRKTERALKKESSDEYDAVFNTAKVIDESLNKEIVSLLNDVPALREIATKHLQLKRLKPLFEIVDGKLKLIRSATLEEGEVIRRALADGKMKPGNEGALWGDLERGLRTKLDDFEPSLKAVRAKWASIMASKDAFKQGRKALRNPDIDAEEIFIENLLDSGSEEALAAYRAGVAESLRRISGRTVGSRTTLIKQLNHLDEPERINARRVLERLYPDDKLENILKKLDQAARSIRTAQTVRGGSQTAITQEAVKRIGSNSLVPNLRAMFRGDVMAPVRLVTDVLKNRAQNLNQSQLTRISQLVVSENPIALRKALTEPNAQRVIINAIENAYGLVQRGASSAGVITVSPLPMESGAIEQSQKIMRQIPELLGLGKRRQSQQ